MGIGELSLGDTIGVATPNQVVDVLGLLLTEGAIPVERLAVHFHDTRGTALANVLIALQLGISIVDSSAGGFGGGPLSARPAGDTATPEPVCQLLGVRVHPGRGL